MDSASFRRYNCCICSNYLWRGGGGRSYFPVLLNETQTMFSQTGEFRIPGRPRTSACAGNEANAGNFWPRRQTTWQKCGWVTEKRKTWNVKRFRRSQNLLTGLRNHCCKQQKENQLVITEKNNEPNQNWPEQCSVSKFNKNAEMVSKPLNKVKAWSYFNVITLTVKLL